MTMGKMAVMEMTKVEKIKYFSKRKATCSYGLSIGVFLLYFPHVTDSFAQSSKSQLESF